MTHNPYPLAGFKDGLFQAKEAFISPNNSYRELRNGRVFRGRLEKRKGFNYFGVCGSELITDPAADVFTPNVAYFFYNTNARLGIVAPGYEPIPPDSRWTWLNIIPSTIVFRHTQLDASVIEAVAFDYDQFGHPEPTTPDNTVKVNALDSSSTELGHYSVYNSTFFVNWELHEDYTGVPGYPDTSNCTITYSAPMGLPICGLSTFTLDGTDNFLAFDTEGCYLWDPGNAYFVPQLGPGLSPTLFTGDYEDLVWVWPVDRYTVFCNGVDPVYRWTPGLAPEPVELQPVKYQPEIGPPLDPLNDYEINTALMIIRFKGRLVYLLPTEEGERFERRARWTTAGSFETFDGDGLGFADAPAIFGTIRTADFVGERLFVGFDDGWMELRSTGDSVAPLEWIPITSRFGAGAKLTTIPDSSRLLSRSETTMQALDPNGQYNIDIAVPDIVTTWSPTLGVLSSALRNEQGRELWWSYVSAADEFQIDAAFVAQYDEQNELSWSIYDVNFRVFGAYEQNQTLNWNDLPGVWNDYTAVRWDDQSVTAGAPIFLGGKYSGEVFRIGFGGSDDAYDVNFYALTQILSPFPGKRAHLGWLDVYAEASQGSEVSITFYDREGAPGYLTKTVDFSPGESSSGKVYRRILVGRYSQFHQFALSHSGTNNFAIDAIIPWFRESSRVDDFG